MAKQMEGTEAIKVPSQKRSLPQSLKIQTTTKTASQSQYRIGGFALVGLDFEVDFLGMNRHLQRGRCKEKFPRTAKLEEMTQIHVVALLCVREGKLLVCRKRGTSMWMQPGGKPEFGETLEDAIRREIFEELEVELENLEYIGQFETLPANEKNSTLLADVFRADLVGEPEPRAEIEAISWLSPEKWTRENTAPLIREHMGPFIIDGCPQ
ncbi:MAG: NUDIX domain-containing protein [Armatimonadetes bacterium]|nr:NUDIX domain-containing protein [Armatimonadota bacterium]